MASRWAARHSWLWRERVDPKQARVTTLADTGIVNTIREESGRGED